MSNLKSNMTNEQLGSLAGKIVDQLSQLTLAQKRTVLSTAAFSLLPFEGSISFKQLQPAPDVGRPSQQAPAGGRQAAKRPVAKQTGSAGKSKVSALKPALRQNKEFLRLHSELKNLNKGIKSRLSEARKTDPLAAIPTEDATKKSELLVKIGHIRDQVEPDRAKRISEEKAKALQIRERKLAEKSARAEGQSTLTAMQTDEAPGGYLSANPNARQDGKRDRSVSNQSSPKAGPSKK